MAFSTRRGRPRTPPREQTDPGTPELRLKHALGVTAEPIDLCFARQLINADQHWSGLHLRWLYTLRYGAPNLTTRYTDTECGPASDNNADEWRIAREAEYHTAITLLHAHQRYESVMRLCVFNESPVFLNPHLRERAWQEPVLARQLERSYRTLTEGLDLLARHWQRDKKGTKRP